MIETNINAISYERYLDKVLGAWIGKSFGGIVGAPFECHKILGDMTAENCWPSEIAPNDDLDIQVVWLELLEERGPDLTREDLVDFWQDRCWYNFAEYGYFLYNEQRGIHPPLSGRFNNIYFRESMGCPIRAEVWGLVSPGNIKLAASYAKMDGEQDHIRNSVFAEQFWAACVSYSFVSDNLDDIMAAGRSVIPKDSDICRLSLEVPELYELHKDWRRVWKELTRKYGHRDASKGELNFAFTVLSLLNGHGDIKETIVTAINCGWDSDCTAATSGALVGVIKGASAMPADWMEKMGSNLTCDVNVRHKTASLADFAADTCKVGLEVAMSRNAGVCFTDVPEHVADEVAERAESRQARDKVYITSSYPGEPVLYPDKPAKVVLEIENKGAIERSGKLSIAPVRDDIHVSPNEISLSIAPGDVQQVLVNVHQNSAAPYIWDKNLVKASWKSEDGAEAEHIFGAGGARQWLLYGPYWDAWDTRKDEICPFRNSEKIVHPGWIGHYRVLYHQYPRLERQYLDEAALLVHDLPDEYPVLLQRGEDHIDAEHLGGFFGEACYYFVRELVADEQTECDIHFGCTSPFVMWIDGEEVRKCEDSSTWGFADHIFRAEFGPRPKRMVIKCAKGADEFRLSICFVKTDVPGDKTVGVSCMLDNIGDVKLKN